jgi:UrcA family protein
MFRRLAITSIAFTLSLFAGAHAGPYREVTQSVTVNYADLDLSRDAGARVLLDRIELAASKACGGEPDNRRAFAGAFQPNVIEYLRCQKNAVRAAVADVNAPLLSWTFAQEEGSPSLSRMAGR